MFKTATKASLSKYLYVLFLVTSLIIISAGCEQKSEKPGEEGTLKDTTNLTQPGTDTTAAADTTKKYPDLTGTWTGTYRSHSATLKITDQNEENVKADLTVQYRETMNKTLSGKFNPETNELSLKDEVKSRDEATYSGKLSDDYSKLSGTARYKVDGKTVNFNFTKK